MKITFFLVMLFMCVQVKGESALTDELIDKIGEKWLQKTITLNLKEVTLSTAFEFVVDYTGDPLGHIIDASEIEDRIIDLKLGMCTRRQALEKIAEISNGVISWDKNGRKPKLTIKALPSVNKQ